MGDCNCNTVEAPLAWNAIFLNWRANNYFTGKLLVERDFTDEQRYFMGKDRRHNQRLHGWGAVCGLKVKPHTQPACADRYLLVEPGYAIDCCGREILVQNEDCFDFEEHFLAAWQKQYGVTATPDDKPHRFQVCIAYKECTTEDVPAMFDDCSGDSSGSRPNRILETYGLDVILDPPAHAPGLRRCRPCVAADTQLRWRRPPSRTQRHQPPLYPHLRRRRLRPVCAGQDKPVHHHPTPGAQQRRRSRPRSFAGRRFSLRSHPGAVARHVRAAGPRPQGRRPHSAQHPHLGAAPDPTIRFATVPGSDGRLLSIGGLAGLTIWPVSVTTGSTAGTAVAAIVNPRALAISPSGHYAYVTATGTNNIGAVDLTQPAFPVTTFPVGAAPSTISVATTTAGDNLAVLDSSNTLFFTGMRPGPSSPSALGSVTGFANTATGVTLSSSGRWAYVLEQDAAGKV